MGSLIHPICGLPLAMFSYGNTVSSIQICNMVVNSIHMSMEEFVNETSKKILLYEIDNVINTITTNYRKKIYCIPGNIRPPPFYIRPFRPRCQRGNLRLGDFRCLKSSYFLIHNFVWANSWRGETVGKWKRAKITRRENSGYWIFLIAILTHWLIHAIRSLCGFFYYGGIVNMHFWNRSLLE